MHYRFLVTFKSDAAKNSGQARRYVYKTLTEEGFVGTESRWGYGICDWFVIGGRWSGELSRHSWAKLLTEQMDALEQEHGVQVWGTFYGDEEQQRIQRELAERFRQMWDATAPAAFRGIPIQRDTYKVEGYEDDAMLLSEGLYNALLKEYAGESGSEYHADLDDENVSPEMVGHKWLVVVDYHS
jgi:hypothetical protein